MNDILDFKVHFRERRKQCMLIHLISNSKLTATRSLIGLLVKVKLTPSEQVSKLKAFKIKIFCPPHKYWWDGIRLTFRNKGTVVPSSVIATPKQVQYLGLIFQASNIYAIMKWKIPDDLKAFCMASDVLSCHKVYKNIANKQDGGCMPNETSSATKF